jgi:chemotaxis protein CheX
MVSENISPHIEINTTLLDSVIRGTQAGFQMTGIQPIAVGASKFPSSKHGLSVLVGLIGEWTGTLTLNVSKDIAFLMTEGLLGERPEEFNEDILDAIGEVGNMIAGAFRDALEPTEISIDGISCPAIVMGPNYEFYYASGFVTVSIGFEVEEVSITKMESRFFSVSVSIMKR